MNEFDHSHIYEGSETGLEEVKSREYLHNELRIHYPLPSLEDLIQELSPLPENLVVIGACDDGLPILLDMRNPASGSILLFGEAGCGKTRLLESIIQSACIVTPPRYLRIAGITSSQLEWHQYANNQHRYKWASTHSLEATNIIRELARIGEERNSGDKKVNTLILVIDELAELLDNLDAETIDKLEWLVRNGPGCAIWTIAAVDSRQATTNPHIYQAFGTYLHGHTTAGQPGSNLPGMPAEIIEELITGAQFCVKVEGEWLRFWIPTAG
jgi:hypothetical protein